MDYIYSVNGEASYYYTDTAHLFKNLSFSPTQNRSRYLRTYIKIDTILGMLGGFSFFVIFLCGCLVRRYNKFKMYMEIGDHLFLSEIHTNNSNLE
jgi:hypothetical protein